MLLFLMFIVHDAIAVSSTSCVLYAQCRSQLLTRKWACGTLPRRAIVDVCRLSQTSVFSSVRQAATLQERFMDKCLSEAQNTSITKCTEPLKELPLRRCGRWLLEHEQQCQRLRKCCPSANVCESKLPKTEIGKSFSEKRLDLTALVVNCRRRMGSLVTRETGAILGLLVSLGSDDRLTEVVRNELMRKPANTSAVAKAAIVSGSTERRKPSLRHKQNGLKSQRGYLSSGNSFPPPPPSLVDSDDSRETRKLIDALKAEKLSSKFTYSPAMIRKPWQYQRQKTTRRRKAQGVTGHNYRNRILFLRSNSTKTIGTTNVPIPIIDAEVVRHPVEVQLTKGSLITFGANALPLPSYIENPLDGFTEEGRLSPAEVTDVIATSTATLLEVRAANEEDDSPERHQLLSWKRLENEINDFRWMHPDWQWSRRAGSVKNFIPNEFTIGEKTPTCVKLLSCTKMRAQLRIKCSPKSKNMCFRKVFLEDSRRENKFMQCAERYVYATKHLDCTTAERVLRLYNDSDGCERKQRVVDVFCEKMAVCCGVKQRCGLIPNFASTRNRLSERCEKP